MTHEIAKMARAAQRKNNAAHKSARTRRDARRALAATGRDLPTAHASITFTAIGFG